MGGENLGSVSVGKVAPSASAEASKLAVSKSSDTPAASAAASIVGNAPTVSAAATVSCVPSAPAEASTKAPANSPAASPAPVGCGPTTARIILPAMLQTTSVTARWGRRGKIDRLLVQSICHNCRISLKI